LGIGEKERRLEINVIISEAEMTSFQDCTEAKGSFKKLGGDKAR